MDRADDRSELIGTVLDGRYQLRAPLGAGATGVVFDGVSLEDGRRVAVKLLKRSFAFHRDLACLMHREAEVGMQLAHPGVVPCWGEGTLPDGSPYLVMQHVGGESLAQLLGRLGSLSVPEALSLAGRVAGILQGVHSAGYVHRDLKPEHILLGPGTGGLLAVHLLDFGVCQPLGVAPDDRERGRVYGTPGYASPEQAAGEVDVDGRSDLYALGAVLFEMLTGRMPLRGRNIAVTLRRTMELDPPCVRALVPHIPPEVAELTAGLLCRQREHRPRNARSVLRHLHRLQPGAVWVERDLVRQLRVGGVQVHAATTVSEEKGAMVAS